MKITGIEIRNIKGINHLDLNLNLIPNKPNIFVAPNGFGKSSLSIGFDSLKRNKIELEDKDYHLNNKANRPILSVKVEDATGERILTADDTQNTITNEIDIFVINSQLIAKATKKSFGGKTIAIPSLDITPTILVQTIPPKVSFSYTFLSAKTTFGSNGGILPNIKNIFSNAIILYDINDEIDFAKFRQVRVSDAIQQIKDDINAQRGTATQIKQWIDANRRTNMDSIFEFNKLASIVRKFNEITSDVDSYLAAFQIIDLSQSMGADFKRAINYNIYIDEKRYYETTISSFNTTRYTIKPKEDKRHNCLVVEWPKAYEISNGQRDVLSFITLLMKVKRNSRKKNCILVIDEIFDYLDDANLISFQYFITTMIEEMKEQGKLFFPILMTHLDPFFFNHFCFNKHKLKVVYLKNIPQTFNSNLIKLVQNRGNVAIQACVDKYHFHFCPNAINITTEFTALGLIQSWGESQVFHQFIETEVQKYLADDPNYDPLAICIGVRVKIELLIYNQITDPVKQQEFIDIHGTKKKLEYSEDIGLSIPEIYYLLGIIYNDNLHLRNGIESLKPIGIKLENLTIKNLIRKIF